MGTRVLSLWLPYLEIERLRWEHGRKTRILGRMPEAVCLGDPKVSPLFALCPLAERAGLSPGMDPAEALGRVPSLKIQVGNPEEDRRFLKTCASWCERYTPFVAIDKTAPSETGGALWLDIGSSAHLSGGEASLLVDLLGRFREKGITISAAIADHPGSAWAASRFGDGERRIQAVNGAAVALAPWPVRALRLDDETAAKLEDAGLDCIEHLYALPRSLLAKRFGHQVATRLDQALGLVDEPIAADQPLPAQQAQMIFAEPITDPTTLPPLIKRLVRQLCIGLEAAGLGAKRLTLALYRVDNSTVTTSIGVDRPCRDLDRLTALIGNRFDEIDLGFGLERIILDAVEIEPVVSEDISWRGLGTVGDDPWPDLAPKPDLGERSETLTFERHRRDFGRVGPTSPSPPSFGQLATAMALPPPDIEAPVLRETPPRPLRLLRQPEPIEAIAALPGEPPVLFRWRNRLHKIVCAKGPETISPDRWRLPETERASLGEIAGPLRSNQTRRRNPKAAARDYFAVEDSEGERFWLFREGRFEGGSETLPRWFLHGLFGRRATSCEA